MHLTRSFLIIGGLICLCGAAGADPACGLYQYRAIVTEVYDGDTITADIDLGFYTWRKDERLRLHGVDTPEVRGPERELGLKVRDALRKRILGKELIICTVKAANKDREESDKYGRYLAKVYVGDELINDWLIREGYGRAYDGGARTPFMTQATPHDQ